MLSFDLRALERRAATVHGELAPDDDIWLDGDLRPSGAIEVRGRLSSAGEGRYYWTGQIRGTVEADCRRCLEPVRVAVSDEPHALFVEEDDADAGDDPDVFLIDPRAHALDLRRAVREQWLLAAPAFVVCREDCRGLCPTCGANLNDGPCACPPKSDRRWDALRTVRSEHQ
jgi:uncharacterized protein